MVAKRLLTLFVLFLSIYSTVSIKCYVQNTVNFTANKGEPRWENVKNPSLAMKSDEYTQCLFVHFFTVLGPKEHPGRQWRMQPVASKANFDTENLLYNFCTMTGFTVEVPFYGAIVCTCNEDYCNSMTNQLAILHSSEFEDIREFAYQAYVNGNFAFYNENVDETKLECLAKKNWTEYLDKYDNQLTIPLVMAHECWRPNDALEIPPELMVSRGLGIPIYPGASDEAIESPYVSIGADGKPRVKTTKFTMYKNEAQNITTTGFDESTTSANIPTTKPTSEKPETTRSPRNISSTQGTTISQPQVNGTSEATTSTTSPGTGSNGAEDDDETSRILQSSNDTNIAILLAADDDNSTSENGTLARTIFLLFSTNNYYSESSSKLALVYIAVPVLLIVIFLLIIILVFVWRRKLDEQRAIEPAPIEFLDYGYLDQQQAASNSA